MYDITSTATHPSNALAITIDFAHRKPYCRVGAQFV